MIIYKFLLIDVALVITAIPLLFLLQGGKKNSPLLRSSNKVQLLRKTTIKLPNKDKLIELEKLAKNQGSGIKFDSLLGNWKFVSVWKKDIDEEDPVFSSLLRIFNAKLELKKVISTDDPLKFSIITSIQFGFFSIEFSGLGCLKGKQPKLPFFFKLIELKSGSSVFLSRPLEQPKEKDKPFFSLIAIDKNGAWLSARGQRGGLILWLKD